MSPPATVVWIAPAPPSAAEARAITSWGRARGIAIAPPSTERLPVLPTEGASASADDVERLLDRARDALVAHEADAVDAALASAEVKLRAHPELPQAAWLMAELERTRSSRWRRLTPVDPVAADRAWMRAEALDGGRVAGVGEQQAPDHPAPSTITLDAPLADDVWIDGEAITGRTAAARAGLHALVVGRHGAPVWATWIDVPPGPSSAPIDAPRAAPCSVADAAGARMADGSIEASQVECPRWLAVRPDGDGRDPDAGVQIAVCEGARCGPLLPWRAPPPWTWTPPPAEHEPGAWPAWATWTLVGVGAVVATGVALVASGALEPAPAETRFVSGGLRTP